MARSQREKGKRGERELSEALRLLGYGARRGRQYQGSPESPDVVTSIPDTHWECKRRERLNVSAIFAQVVAEAEDRIPILAHRRSRAEWLVTIRLEDLPRFAEALQRATETEPSKPLWPWPPKDGG